MKMWINAVKAEVIKLKRRGFFAIHVLLPVIGAILMALYYRMTSVSMENKFYVYSCLVAGIYPFMISIVTAMSFGVEEENGFYCLLSGKSRSTLLIAKLAVLFGMGCVSTLTALVLFPLLVGKCYGFDVYLQVFLVISITNMLLYMIQGFLFLRFGRSVSIFTGICGLLLALVFLTGLGDGIWKWIPWTMGTRGAVTRVMLANTSIADYENYRVALLADYAGFPWICAGELLVVGIGLLLWFRSWEGRKVYD